MDGIDGIRLVAGACPACGKTVFPRPQFCDSCGHDGDFDDAPLLTQGTLYTFTNVHLAREGFPTPYAIGYVDFPEGPRVFGRLLTDDPIIGQNIASVVDAETGAVGFVAMEPGDG